MIKPYSPDQQTLNLFETWLKHQYPKTAENMIKYMKGDSGAIIVLHNDVTFENHIICCYGSMSFVEIYKMLTPTHFVRVPNNNEGLLPNTAPKSS